jgi:hypothetical protein
MVEDHPENAAHLASLLKQKQMSQGSSGQAGALLNK